MLPRVSLLTLHSCALTLALAGVARADIPQDWLAQIPVGSSLTAGIQGMVVDAAGVSYVTGVTGSSSNTDVITAAFTADGGLLWSDVFNGPKNWHDQGHDVALAPGGVLYVTGSSPGSGMYATALLLKYDAATGSLLNVVQYSSGAGNYQYGHSVRTDPQGDVYVLGGTGGDGPDVLILKFDPQGTLLWKRTWDGPANAPYSLDSGVMIRVGPDGAPIALIQGVMNSLHPDYVVVKYDPTNGSTIWESTWGVTGGDSPSDMEIDPAGDVYVTGTGIDFTDKFSTIKLRGANGKLLWQKYDHLHSRNRARALALDGQGGVLITGSVDPEGDQSNFNDKFYTIKRDAADGSLYWTHVYGKACVGCLDVPSDVGFSPSGHVLVVGETSSAPYKGDMIVFALDPASGVELDRGVVAEQGPIHVLPQVLRFDATYDLFIGGDLVNYNNSATDISVVKFSNLAYAAGNYCTLSPNSMGPGAVIGSTGSAAISENDFNLTVEGAAASQPGLFFYGPDQADQPFGDGRLCIGGGFFRLNPVVTTDGAGSVGQWVDFTQPPVSSGPGQIDPGSSWNFQFWFRDPAAGGATFNTSDGLAVTFLP